MFLLLDQESLLRAWETQTACVLLDLEFVELFFLPPLGVRHTQCPISAVGFSLGVFLVKDDLYPCRLM